MNNPIGKRAIVIGAGIGGLLSAAAVSPYFAEIVVLERDRLPSSASPRAGVPQDRQPHFLLAGGLQGHERLVPGFETALLRAGAVPINVFREMRYERPDIGVLPQRDCELTILCATRPLIEHVLRQRIVSFHNVTLRSECRVTDLVTDDRRRSVRFEIRTGGLVTLDADLVVDASGRGAPTFALLETLGWPRPIETTVGVDIGYTTAVLPRLPANSSHPKIVITLPDPSKSAFAGLLMPIEGGQWFVSVSEHGAKERPKTWTDLLSILRRLHTSTIYDAVRDLQPVDGLRHFIFKESRWRHFERLKKLPRGILPIADSICRFNPIYAQGMSIAAQQAELLGQAIRSAAQDLDFIEALQIRFMAEVGQMLEAPWTFGVSADFAFPGTRGERPQNYHESRQFEANLFRAAVADPLVQKTFSSVLHLTRPFESFQNPDIRRRIEAHVAAKSA